MLGIPETVLDPVPGAREGRGPKDWGRTEDGRNPAGGQSPEGQVGDTERGGNQGASGHTGGGVGRPPRPVTYTSQSYLPGEKGVTAIPDTQTRPFGKAANKGTATS